MRIFIPPEHIGLARELSLQKWVEGKRWPCDRYFQMIDRLRVALSTLDDDSSDNPDAIVYLLASCLRVDEPFRTYILDDRKANMGDDKEWFMKCLSGAWAIIQRYSREVDKGTWKTDLSGAPQVGP